MQIRINLDKSVELELRTITMAVVILRWSAFLPFRQNIRYESSRMRRLFQISASPSPILTPRPAPILTTYHHHVDNHHRGSADLIPPYPPSQLQCEPAKNNSALSSLELHLWHQGEPARRRPLGPRAPEAPRRALRAPWPATHLRRHPRLP